MMADLWAVQSTCSSCVCTTAMDFSINTQMQLYRNAMPNCLLHVHMDVSPWTRGL